MTQKRRKTRGASRKQKDSHHGGGLRPYLAGVATGLFAAFMLYLATLPPEEGQGFENEPVAAVPTPAPSPKYEFYELLPEQDITVDVDPAELPKPRSESDQPRYLLQAGSFRQAEDADRRRAELLLLGLEPKVEETNGNNGRWFRVVVGPFESRSAMAKARSLTAQQNIDTLLMQRKAG